MKAQLPKVFRRFADDQDGATPVEYGAAIIAAIAFGIGFIFLLDGMI